MRDFTVRRLTRGELDTVLDWAAAEGWNPGLHDAPCFWAQDPQGFFGAELDGRLVGSLAMVRYQGGFAFAGLFLVQAAHRGRGLGRAMTEAAMAHAAGDCIGLDGVVAQQDNYRVQSGAVYAHRNRRYAGLGGGEAPAGLIDLAQVAWDELLALDTRCFLSPRPDFLRAWIGQPGHRGLAARHGGRLTGYGVIRPCRAGFKIGPLFAQTPEQGRAIFRGLMACAPGQPVQLDAPEANPAAVAMAEAAGMDLVFETARMYVGGPRPLPLEWTFGITTYELG